MDRRRAWLFGSSTLFVAFAIWASCAVYDPSLLTPADAAADAPGDGGAETSSCAHATVPDRPTKDDPAVADGGELTFVVNQFAFEPRLDAGALRGYDLDRSCTCPDTPSCKSPKSQCDDEAGRDNVGGIQLDTFAKLDESFSPVKLNTRLQMGLYGLLFRVIGWNGSPNDTSVQFAVYVSKGTPTLDGGARVTPKFDGTDVFTVAKASLLGGVAPPYIPLPDSVDTNAYVSNGTVVASASNVRLELSTNDAALNYLEMNLTGVQITAKIAMVGGKVQLTDGIIAGRWPTRRFLTALAPQSDPIVTGGFLCGDSSTYASVKGFVCNNVDITSAVQNDNTNATCDALSVALGWTAVPVIFGPVSAGVTLNQPCGAQWTDDCN